MRRMARILWGYVSQDPVLVPTTLVCLVLGLAKLFDVAPTFGEQKFFGLTLIALSAFSLSLVAILRKLREIETGERLSPTSRICNAFPTDFDDDIADAKKLWIVGVSCSDLIEKYSNALKENLESGGRIFFLLVDPNSPSCTVVSGRDSSITPTGLSYGVEYQRARIAKTLEMLDSWKRRHPSLEVKTIDYPMEFEAVISDIGRRKTAYLRHYPFRSPLGDEMRITIPSQDIKQFKYYETHVSNLWTAGTPFSKNTHRPKPIEEPPP